METGGLKAIEEVLELPELKPKKVVYTRWFSHDKVLPAIIASLECEVTERVDCSCCWLKIIELAKHCLFVSDV